jgi:hypothetical protein
MISAETTLYLSQSDDGCQRQLIGLCDIANSEQVKITALVATSKGYWSVTIMGEVDAVNSFKERIKIEMT